jgi:hypothetical protein
LPFLSYWAVFPSGEASAPSGCASNLEGSGSSGPLGLDGPLLYCSFILVTVLLGAKLILEDSITPGPSDTFALNAYRAATTVSED